MIHYHGTPINPKSEMFKMAGEHFCVSHSWPEQAELAHEIGQSVVLDNGAFRKWRSGLQTNKISDWDSFYRWAEPFLEFHTTWAILPDVIGGTEFENNALMYDGFERLSHRKNQIAPVWHVDEEIGRLKLLMHKFDRVCFGSSGKYRKPGSPIWNNRMNDVFNEICHGTGRPPVWIHMLRGMALSGSIYPFASVDSADVARNHNRQHNPREMADRWDALQCPSIWVQREVQMELSQSSRSGGWMNG